ncbi:hypothetical protein [Streptomyces sp. GQFP]|uniref:hypothetical protein n=1 Tax=Streptomyces sp. GQFP TaxID=2907545 RepID=UPI001F3327DF|nr:hypothetical protein [Streptomyces sp. GQFP]UIX29561.1 hypothetical protein LUX31_05650 [Streptomyces sp. GQFP]
MRTAATIIEQLEANHAASNAAGLGSPELDAFHNLLVELIAEAPEPEFRLREIVDLLAREHSMSAKSA